MNQMAPEPTGCRCGKPTRDAAYVCEDCLDQLQHNLAETPWLLDELEGTTRGIDYTKLGGAKASEHPLPINTAATEARHHITGILTAWVKYCHDTGIRNSSPTEGLPADNPRAMSRWLLWRIDGLAYTELGPDAATEIGDAFRKGKRIIDRPPDKWYAGPCEECQADLYAKTTEGHMACRECGRTYDIAERRAWLMGEAEDRLATATVIAGAIPTISGMQVTANRIQLWKSRGHLLPHGHDGSSPLYRVGDIIDLLTMGPKKYSAGS